LQAIIIQFTSINAERLATALPPRIDFNVNVTIPSGEPARRDNQYIIPFVFTLFSNPPVVQITLKGVAVVSSDRKSDIDRIEEDIAKKKQIPAPVIQAVFVNSLAEVILLSRSLALPPPIPMPQQLMQIKPQAPEEKKGFDQEPVI